MTETDGGHMWASEDFKEDTEEHATQIQLVYS